MQVFKLNQKYKTLNEQIKKLESVLDAIGGQAYDAEVYGEDELRTRMRAIRSMVRTALHPDRGE